MNSILKSRILIGLIFFSAPHLQAVEPEDFTAETKPVEIKIDELELARLSPDRREVVKKTLELIKNNLIEWSKFDANLPATRFAPDASHSAQIVEISSLFKRPSSDEVPSLAVDEMGVQIPLSLDDLESIEKNGLLIIPSREYPGQNHVWKISLLFQKGAENIELSYRQDLSKALNQLVIQIPTRLSSSGFLSVGRGLTHFYGGLRGILSNLVGLSETAPKYYDHEIDELIEKEKKKYVKEHALNYFPRNENYPSEIDLRLYDDSLTKSMQPILDKVSKNFSDFWQSMSFDLRMKIKSDLIGENFKGLELEVQLDKRMDQEKLERFNQFLLENKEIERLESGYARLLVNRNIAVAIGEQVEKNLVDMMKAQEEVIRQQIALRNPIEALVKPWFEQKVAEETTKFYRDVRWDHLSLIPLTLESKGLYAEAFAYWQAIEFQKSSEEKIKKDLISETEAARTFEFETRIWNTDHWIVNKLNRGEAEEPYYTADVYRTERISTDQPLWRLRNVALETKANVKNGLYQVLVSNLWNGPWGLRSLFSNKPFYASKTMDHETGKIIDDPSSLTPTFRSRLVSIWENIEKSKQEFESAPDTGLLGKRYTRWIHRLWNYALKGPMATIGIALGQPVATICNALTSTCVAASAPVWAPLTGIFKLGFSSLVYDLNAPDEAKHVNRDEVRHWFPLISYAVSDVGIQGAGQVALAATSAAVIHPLTATTVATYGFLRKHIRTGYDRVIRKLLLQKGHYPITDSFVASRISGPGMSSNYFYQIEPELALIAMLAKLEELEIKLFKARVGSAISKPRREFNQFFSSLLPFATIKVTDDSFEKIIENENKLVDAFNKKINDRKDLLDKALSMPYDVNKVKLSKLELEKTLELGSLLVKTFLESNIKPKVSEEEYKQIWNHANIDIGDYKGLTQQYLSSLFTSSILIPLEVNDESFVLTIPSDGMKELLQGIFN